ncbi:hypothetical protein QJS10_CPB11g01637 [Acorus calamus]|uniref:Uncharacterized protein n=1 Tax=Acorus calamus TaxID=4465 RepID=A0AAV9DRK8_ACOCL|nr:hypothetical protein QJS10_CPB11g01637 [Acorus calamus]
MPNEDPEDQWIPPFVDLEKIKFTLACLISGISSYLMIMLTLIINEGSPMAYKLCLLSSFLSFLLGNVAISLIKLTPNPMDFNTAVTVLVGLGSSTLICSMMIITYPVYNMLMDVVSLLIFLSEQPGVLSTALNQTCELEHCPIFIAEL